MPGVVVVALLGSACLPRALVAPSASSDQCPPVVLAALVAPAAVDSVAVAVPVVAVLPWLDHAPVSALDAAVPCRASACPCAPVFRLPWPLLLAGAAVAAACRRTADPLK